MLFVAVGITVWVELLFPAWILALSVDILVAARGPPSWRVMTGSSGRTILR